MSILNFKGRCAAYYTEIIICALMHDNTLNWSITYWDDTDKNDGLVQDIYLINIFSVVVRNSFLELITLYIYDFFLLRAP